MIISCIFKSFGWSPMPFRLKKYWKKWPYLYLSFPLRLWSRLRPMLMPSSSFLAHIFRHPFTSFWEELIRERALSSLVSASTPRTSGCWIPSMAGGYNAAPCSYPLPQAAQNHDDVIKWKHFPRYWPFVRGIHRTPVNSPHKDQWRGALMFSLICI